MSDHNNYTIKGIQGQLKKRAGVGISILQYATRRYTYG